MSQEPSDKPQRHPVRQIVDPFDVGTQAAKSVAKEKQEPAPEQTGARAQLQRVISSLPQKREDKLPSELLVMLPLVAAVGAMLMMVAVFTATPEAKLVAKKSSSHFVAKTNELLDYASLSVGAGVSAAVYQGAQLVHGPRVSIEQPSVPYNYGGRQAAIEREPVALFEVIDLMAGGMQVALSMYSFERMQEATTQLDVSFRNVFEEFGCMVRIAPCGTE